MEVISLNYTDLFLLNEITDKMIGDIMEYLRNKYSISLEEK